MVKNRCKFCQFLFVLSDKFCIFASCMWYLLESPMRFFAPFFGGFSLFYYLCTQKRN